MSKNGVLTNGSFWRTRTHCVEHGLPTLFGHCDMCGHLSAICHQNNSRKFITSWNTNPLGIVLRFGHTRSWKKIGATSRVLKHDVLTNRPFWPTWKQHGIFWTSFKWPKLLPARGHAHGIHRCLVVMTSNTVCTLQQMCPFTSLLHQNNSSKFITWRNTKPLAMVPWFGQKETKKRLGPFQGQGTIQPLWQ